MRGLLLFFLVFPPGWALIPSPFELSNEFPLCSRAEVFDSDCFCVHDGWRRVPWNMDIIMNFINFNKFIRETSFEDFIHRMVFQPFSHFHEKNLHWLFSLREPKCQDTPLVPLKLHRIWISNKETGNPSIFAQDFLKNAESDLKVLGNGWEFVFWFFKEPMQEDTRDWLFGVFKWSKLSFRDVRSLDLDSELLQELEAQYSNGLFSCMADSLRLHILVQEGGLYVDADIRINYNVTKFAFNTKLLMLSHPLFLFHHFLMAAPRFHSELLLNVTYAHRNNFNAIMNEYSLVAEHRKPPIVILVRDLMHNILYTHKSERRLPNPVPKAAASNSRVHNHDIRLMVRRVVKPYFGTTYEILPDVMKYLKEPVIVRRKETKQLGGWLELGETM